MKETLQKAFENIKRKDFVPSEMMPWAELNEALPIGYEQTISQPQVVSFMLQQLEVKEGERVLDIGAGSGWTTALLAFLVGAKGKVVAIELIEELAEFGRHNVAKYSFIDKGIVTFLTANGYQGYTKEAPYDKILVSAALDTKKLPQAWQDQLRKGGKIAVPVKESIWVFTKRDDGSFEEQEYPGFVFVPFVNP